MDSASFNTYYSITRFNTTLTNTKLHTTSFTFFKTFHSNTITSSSIHLSANPNSDVAITSSSTSPLTKLQSLKSEFKSIPDSLERAKHLLHYAKLLPEANESIKVTSNRVMGCTAQVWLDVKMNPDGTMRFTADSDSDVTRGYCYCLISVLDGAMPEDVLMLKTEDLGDLSVGVNNVKSGYNSRVNTWYNVLVSMQKRTKAIVAERDGRVSGEAFPALVITKEGVEARGGFAEAQVLVLRWGGVLNSD